MRNSVSIVLDTGPVISLAVIGRLDLLTRLFSEISIPRAVWEELNKSDFFKNFPEIEAFFKDRIKNIHSINELILITDYGESESMLLCKELDVDFLVIDDRKARTIAEALGINCIGTLAILIKAKEKGFITTLKPIFESLIENRRFYSKKVLNTILAEQNEPIFE